MKKLLILLLLTLGLIGVSFADDSQEAIEREIAEFEAELEAEEKPKSYSKSINAQVAKNAIRCLALSYLQTTIPENEKVSSNFIVDISGKYYVNKKLRLTANIINLLDNTYAVSRVPAGLRPGHPFGANLGLEFRF